LWNTNNDQLYLTSLNNFVEGWNRVLQDSLNRVFRPDIFKLILALQKEQSKPEMNLIRINCGEKLPIPKLRETPKRENIVRWSPPGLSDRIEIESYFVIQSNVFAEIESNRMQIESNDFFDF
jgi:hypothetical protein